MEVIGVGCHIIMKQCSINVSTQSRFGSLSFRVKDDIDLQMRHINTTLATIDSTTCAAYTQLTSKIGAVNAVLTGLSCKWCTATHRS